MIAIKTITIIRNKSRINPSMVNVNFVPVKSNATFSDRKVLNGDKSVNTKKIKNCVTINLMMLNAPPRIQPKIEPINGMSSRKETDDSTVPRKIKTCQNKIATTIPGIKNCK